LRYWPLGLVLLALSGCSTTHSVRTKSIMEPFIGHPVSDVAARFGPPDGNFEIIDTGQMAFQWNRFDLNQALGMAGQAAAPARSTLGECRVLVTTLATPKDSPTTDLTKWFILSWDAYGNCV
jgi:hypothetical protein